jgi:hypothetical protein
MEYNNKFYNYLLRWFCLAGMLLFIGCLQDIDNGVNPDNPTKTFPPVKGAGVLGAWWWWESPENWERYLDFAAENGVTEIYFEHGEFDESAGSFIERAQDKGIRVYHLVGGHTYIWNYPSFEQEMERFMAYQDSASEHRKYAGLHLDIEPHQHHDFAEDGKDFVQDFMDFIVWVYDTYRSRGISIDIDIPLWLNVFEVDYRGGKRILSEALIVEADRVFVMSYRDTAEGIYGTASDELAFAKIIGKQIILCVETGHVADEEAFISFYGRSLSYFYGELEKLYSLLDAVYDNYGLSIHYITSWYAMR